MTRHSVLIHAAVLAALLVAAYLVWTREPSTSSDTDIPLLSLRAGLDQAVYKDEDRTVTVTRRKDSQGSHYWVAQQTWEKAPVPVKKPEPKAEAKKPEPKAEAKKPEPKAEAKKPEPKAEAKKPEPKAEAKKPEPKVEPKKPKDPPKVRKSKQFKGGKAAEEMMKGLAKLSVMRSLGTVPADKLKAFGLQGSKKSLVLKSGGMTRELTLGSNAHGSMDRYIQDKQDGRVYVIRPRLLADFPYAEYRLMDRDLHGFVRKEIEKVVISGKAGKKTLVQQNRRTPASAFWADEAAPRKRKELYGNWMDKLSRLSVLEYVANKKQSDLTEELTVQYFGAAKNLGQLRLYSAAGLAPAPGKKLASPAKQYYARTGSTRALVKVSGPMAGEILRDAAGVLK